MGDFKMVLFRLGSYNNCRFLSMITLALAATDPAKARNEDILPSGISDTQTIPAEIGIVTAANIGWRPFTILPTGLGL